MTRARDFFTAEEREKINQAVTEAEKTTAGEIVPVVAASSGRYDRPEDLGGFLLALLLLTAGWLAFQGAVPADGDWAHGFRLTLRLRWVLLILIGGFIVGVALTSRVGWLRRLLATEREMRAEVERAAWEAFARLRVTRTTGGTGILLYLSLFERMVCVVGDEPIVKKVDQKAWDDVRDTLVAGLRGKRAADALCQAIARSGELLRTHFPVQPGDVNELSNELKALD
jgi:putative membrane protein